ncbi:hypothetical protein D3C76_1579620 [compost metagenome]
MLNCIHRQLSARRADFHGICGQTGQLSIGLPDFIQLFAEMVLPRNGKWGTACNLQDIFSLHSALFFSLYRKFFHIFKSVSINSSVPAGTAELPAGFFHCLFLAMAAGP